MRALSAGKKVKDKDRNYMHKYTYKVIKIERQYWKVRKNRKIVAGGG